MPGARSLAHPADAPKKPKERPFKRHTAMTESDKNLVAAVVVDSPGGVTPKQINALATVLKRSKDDIRTLVEDARQSFAASAGDYVRMHKEATEKALENGDAKSLEVVAKASQWAMTAIVHDGARVVEKQVSDGGGGGTKIMIGVKLGGIDSALPTVSVTPVPDPPV